MPKDKDFKRLVRRRMQETGERYAQASTQLRPGSSADWKEQHIARADAAPMAVWRVFAAPEGQPFDIRQRFFTDPVDADDARSREERLRTEVLRILDEWRREPYMTNSLPRPQEVPGLEMHFNEGFRGRRTGFVHAGPKEATRLPVAILAARALTEITGQVHAPVVLTARYRAVVTAEHTVKTELEILDSGVTGADIRRALVERMHKYPAHPSQCQAIEAGVYADGHAALIVRLPPSATYGIPDVSEPVLSGDDLMAAAVAELTD